MARIPNGFPKDFLWGGAVAANQLEGASYADRRGKRSSGRDQIPLKNYLTE